VARSTRMLKFGVAGGAAALVNLATVWLGVERIFRSVPSATEISVALGIMVSICASFFFHQFWTWADRIRPQGGAALVQRLARYYAVGAASAAVQWLVAMGVREGLGLHYLVASAAGIGAAAVTNYVAAGRWVFGSGASESVL